MNDTEGKANNLLLLIFHHVFFPHVLRFEESISNYSLIQVVFFHTTVLKRDFIGVPFLIFRKVCKDICVCVQKLLNLNLRSKQEVMFLWISFDLANWRNSFVYGRYIVDDVVHSLLFFLWQHLEFMRCFIKTNGKSHRLTLSFQVGRAR